MMCLVFLGAVLSDGFLGAVLSSRVLGLDGRFVFLKLSFRNRSSEISNTSSSCLDSVSYPRIRFRYLESTVVCMLYHCGAY